VDEKAGRSDSMAGAVTGTVIRSFSVLALNNEAAAASIENLAAVIARKVSRAGRMAADLHQHVHTGYSSGRIASHQTLVVLVAHYALVKRESRGQRAGASDSNWTPIRVL